MNANKAEKGQVLVLILLAMVALFGFAGLAVDAGRLYSERRRAQSASDASALAAAYAASQGENSSTAEAFGLSLAATNGFNNDGVNNTVTVNNPPVSGPYSGDDHYYQVVIWQHVDPIFSQLVFGGEEGVTTEAVAHAIGVESVSDGQAIHSLSTGNDSMFFDGGVAVEVDGGNIHSNGDMTKHGTGSLPQDDKITVTHGGISAHGRWLPTGHPVVNPTPSQGAAVIDAEAVPTPSCPQTVSASTPAHEAYTNPDGTIVHYYYHKTELNGSATLQPGFHCFYGGIRLAGGDTVTGNGVVMVMMQGGISMTGHSVMQVKRPNDIVDKNGNHWGGLLMYAPKTNASDFKLGGTSDSIFRGTVLMPGGTCDIGGTETTSGMHMALICNKIKTHGNSKVKIVYRAEENYRMSPTVELAQ